MTALWRHRRLVFSLILCVVVALGVAAAWRTFGPANAPDSTGRVSPTPSPTLALHETYDFHLQTLPPSVLSAGTSVTFRWIPVPQGPVAATSGPAALYCTLVFLGPYPSLADLTQASNPADGSIGTPVFTAPPLTMSDWDAVSRPIDVYLPKTLHAGYYLVMGKSESARDNGTSQVAFPVQLVA